MSQSKYPPETRANAAKEYLAGNASCQDIARKYGIDKTTLKTWAGLYKFHGISAFTHSKNNSYTKEFKEQCVKLVLSGKYTIYEVVSKYGIPCHKVLRSWIKVYNANRELKDYIPKQEVYMAEARRKTSIEERKEIVEYCIEHNRDYKNTAAKYDVSYSQVYTWVRKYDAVGELGLTDRRGRHKTNDEVDELEHLQRENMRLKRQLEEKDMVVELLKKVKEFEGM